MKNHYYPEITFTKHNLYNFFYLRCDLYGIEMNFEQYKHRNMVWITFNIGTVIVSERFVDCRDNDFHNYLMSDLIENDYHPQHLQLLIYLKNLYRDNC